MTKTVTRMIASMAAFGLVATPIVAQANTRAGDSAVTYSTTEAGPGLGREAEGEGAFAIASVLGVLVVLTPIVIGALIASGVIQDDDGNCISPGACG